MHTIKLRFIGCSTKACRQKKLFKEDVSSTITHKSYQHLKLPLHFISFQKCVFLVTKGGLCLVIVIVIQTF